MVAVVLVEGKKKCCALEVDDTDVMMERASERTREEERKPRDETHETRKRRADKRGRRSARVRRRWVATGAIRSPFQTRINLSVLTQVSFRASKFCHTRHSCSAHAQLAAWLIRSRAPLSSFFLQPPSREIVHPCAHKRALSHKV